MVIQQNPGRGFLVCFVVTLVQAESKIGGVLETLPVVFLEIKRALSESGFIRTTAMD
jgi:hypothetical protein